MEEKKAIYLNKLGMHQAGIANLDPNHLSHQDESVQPNHLTESNNFSCVSPIPQDMQSQSTLSLGVAPRGQGNAHFDSTVRTVAPRQQWATREGEGGGG